MKKYSDLINRQFKVDRKKNILTIIGIMTSILLLISVGQIKNFINEFNIERVKQLEGNYEVILKDLSSDSVERIKNNVKVDKCGLYNIEKSIDITIKDTKRSLKIYSGDDIFINEVFDSMLEIVEGKLPNSKNEIILTLSAKSQLNKKIGDKLNIDDSEYIIVGFYKDNEDTVRHTLTGVTFLNSSNTIKKINAAIIMKDKKSIIEDIKEIIGLCNIDEKAWNYKENIKYNNMLLEVYGVRGSNNIGNINSEKVTIFFIYLTICLLTILFIYGSLSGYLQDRRNEISILRCIGATKNKIIYLLIKEWTILFIISLIIGILLGNILSWLIVDVLFIKVIGVYSYGVGFKIYYNVILITIVFSIINMVIGIILLIRNGLDLKNIKVGKVNNLKITYINKRKSKIIRFLFGYKGEIAYRNIGANRRNFFIITASLTIILIIFNSFTGFYLLNLKQYEYELRNSYDISSTYDVESSNNYLLEDILDKRNNYKREFNDLKVADDILMNISMGSTITIEDIIINPELTKYYVINKSIENIEEDTVKFNEGSILIYDKASLNEIIPYINSITDKNINIKDFNESGFVIVNTGFNHPKPIFKENSEQEVKLYLNENSNLPIEARILGSIDSDKLISGNRFGYYNRLTIIVSDEFYYKNKDIMNNLISTYKYINTSINLKENINTQIAISKIKDIVNKNGGYYLQEKETLDSYKNNMDALAVLIYTMMFLVIFIGAINIINTRYTNIILRKKEFGTLLAIGIQKGDLRKIIILEGIVQWFISGTIGIALSLISFKVIGMIFSYSVGRSYYISNLLIVIGVFILLVINLLSSFIPYIKLKKLEINELIRNEE
ncbi:MULTISPECIES: ABC transporter permease [Clostridium]|nr:MULTISPECIES: FtsX-like permease family protein [Clostridium]MBS4840828.1 FtsX-like permease family protein [Clostridium sp.]MDU1401732.1 FtsX-like permease family protein [Clostridium sp.]MDU4925344.1 FtsX-like permease family protein [Clostridium sp.]